MVYNPRRSRYATVFPSLDAEIRAYIDPTVEVGSTTCTNSRLPVFTSSAKSCAGSSWFHTKTERPSEFHPINSSRPSIPGMSLGLPEAINHNQFASGKVHRGDLGPIRRQLAALAARRGDRFHASRTHLNEVIPKISLGVDGGKQSEPPIARKRDAVLD